MRTEIICELASCWNGDPDLLKALIKAAAENGGDIIKIQDYRADRVPVDDPDKARYEKYQMRDELYPQFIEWCREFGVKPLTTCFNADRAEYLASLGLKTIKLASISLTNHDLILAAGANFDEVILSTGFASRDEIEEVADLLASNCKKFSLMTCTTEYPCPIELVSLRRVDEIKKILDGQEYASVGASNHCLDVDSSKALLAKDLSYLEVHFSLSRSLPQIQHQMFQDGPLITTHAVSYEPHELLEISKFRDKMSLMFGSGEFGPSETGQKIKDRYSNRYGN